MKEPAVVCKENNMADASGKASAKPRNRQWTEPELKYFALVLADEKDEFGYELDTLALKKTANKPVFEDIKEPFRPSFGIRSSTNLCFSTHLDLARFCCFL